MFKKLLISFMTIATLICVGLPINFVSADEDEIMPIGLTCPDCGKSSITISTSYRGWFDDDEIPCTHGKGSNYYDVPQWCYVFKTHTCKNCGYSKTYTSTEWKIEKCYHY